MSFSRNWIGIFSIFFTLAIAAACIPNKQMTVGSAATLLEDVSISGAKGLLMNITGPPDITMDEIDEASAYIMQEADDDAEIFWGVVFDENMDDEIQITVIATGIDKQEYSKVVKLRDVSKEDIEEEWTVKLDGKSLENLETPTYQREIVKEPRQQPMQREMHDRPMRREVHNEEKKGFFRRTFFKDDLDYPTFLRAKAD